MAFAATGLQSPQLVENIAEYQNGIPQDMRPLLSAKDPFKYIAQKRLMHQLFQDRDVVGGEFAPLHAAITSWYSEWGHARIFKLFACLPQMQLRVIAHALWSGNLSVLTLLPVDMLREVPSYVVDFAAFKGDTSVLKYLHDVVGLDVSTPGAMHNAAQFGHLGVIRYLYELNNDTDVGCASLEAVYYGHLDVIEFFHHHCTSYDFELSFLPAIDRQDLPVAQLLVDLIGKDICDGYQPMDFAAYHGLMESLEWLHKRGFTCSTGVMDRAAGRGRLDVVKWLHANRSEGCTEAAMHLAAVNGRLEVVEWLLLNRHEGCTTTTLAETTSDGSWDVVRFLVANGIGTGGAETALAIALKNPDTPADVVELLAKSVAIESNGRQRKKRCI